MKKSRYYIFNPALYRDMLRQLRLTGFVMAAICVVISIISPVISMISGRTASPVSLSGLSPVLWVYMFVGGAGLVFSAFSYLNKRNGSDFYHSLPSTSFASWSAAAAAAATWIVSTVAATLLISYGAYWAAGARPALLYLPYLMGYFSIGALLVASAASIAVCVTGTSLTNIVVTGLIVFLPRFVSTLLSVAIANVTMIIPVDSMGMVFNPQYNIAAAPISAFSSLFSYGGGSLAEFLPGYVYSAALAALYFAAAAFLYGRRKSEVAGMGAASRLLQHVFRSVLIVPILMILPIQLISDEYSSLDDNIGLAVVLFFVSLIVYFTYELITTKKFKNVLTTLPLFLALVIAVPSVIYFGARGASKALLSISPDADDIRGVTVVQRSGGLFGYYEAPSYSSLLASEVVHTNPELREIVAKALDRSIAAVRNGSLDRSSDMQVLLGIRHGLGSMERVVLMTAGEYTRYGELIASNPDYVEALREGLPKDSEVYSVYYSAESYDFGAADQEFAKKLWKSFRDELSSLEGEALYKALNSEHRGGAYITVSGYRGVRYFASRYAIGFETPNTLRLTAKEQNGKNGEFFKELLDRVIADTENKFSGDFSGASILSPDGEVFPLELYIPELMKETAGIIKDIDLGAFDGQSAYLVVSYYTYEYDDYGNARYDSKNGQVFVPLTSEQAELLKAASNRLNSGGESGVKS